MHRVGVNAEVTTIPRRPRLTSWETFGRLSPNVDGRLLVAGFQRVGGSHSKSTNYIIESHLCVIGIQTNLNFTYILPLASQEARNVHQAVVTIPSLLSRSSIGFIGKTFLKETLNRTTKHPEANSCSKPLCHHVKIMGLPVLFFYVLVVAHSCQRFLGTMRCPNSKQTNAHEDRQTKPCSICVFWRGLWCSRIQFIIVPRGMVASSTESNLP